MTFVSDTKFLGIVTYNTLLWKIHIEWFIPKLSVVCNALRYVKVCIWNIDGGLLFQFLTIMNYRLIFYGNSWCSIKNFGMQEITIRIVMGWKVVPCVENCLRN
jgi:hypothetical protein